MASPVGDEERCRTRGSDSIVAIDWAAGGQLLAATLDGEVLVNGGWRRGPGGEDGNSGSELVAACWSAPSTPVVASTGGHVSILDDGHPAGRGWRRSIEAGEPILDIVASRAGVVAAHGEAITVASEDSTAEPLALKVGRLRALVAVSGSYAVAVGADGAAFVDTAFGALDGRIELDGALSIAVDGSGEHLAIGDVAGSIQVLRIGHQLNGRELTGYPDPVRLLAWTDRPFGVVALADDELTFWHHRAGEVAESPISATVGGAPLCALAAAPFGSLVATGDVDGRVDVWSLHALGRPVWRAVPLGGEITVLRWSPDGARLAAGTTKGDVAVWSRRSIV
ncbi:MAG: hypothetical protein ACK5OX_01565 [Desertimonas sp.]